MFLLHLCPAGQESWLTMWESTKLLCYSTAKVLWLEAPLLQALLPTRCLSLAHPSAGTAGAARPLASSDLTKVLFWGHPTLLWCVCVVLVQRG